MEDFFKWFFLYSFLLAIILGVGFRMVEKEEGSEHEGRHDGLAFKMALFSGFLGACFKSFH